MTIEKPESAAASQVSEVASIDITDFAKVELVVGTIMNCEPIPNSSKLYKLQVDFGPERSRQILSGVQQLFSVEELVNKQAIFVLNLKPRMMMGLESHGMLLVAGTALSTVSATVPKWDHRCGKNLKVVMSNEAFSFSSLY